MLYDPNHDNTIGLPASYTAYHNGGWGRVNTEVFLPNKGSSIAGNSLRTEHHMQRMLSSGVRLKAWSLIGPNYRKSR